MHFDLRARVGLARRFMFVLWMVAAKMVCAQESRPSEGAVQRNESSASTPQVDEKNKLNPAAGQTDSKGDSNEASAAKSLVDIPTSKEKDDPAPKLELPAAPAATPSALSESPLREKISRVLDAYIERPENSAERAPWGAMHGFISYGVDSTILVNQQRVNCIAYLAYNNPCRGVRLLEIQNGRPAAKVGVNVQGHEGQFLAMLAQSRVPKEYPLRVNGQNFSVADLIENEKKTCKTRTELTFKLIALSHYLELEETWKADSGETWSLSRLIQEELAQPVIGGACGGTHRLMGLSYAARNREKRGSGVLDGEWARASKFVREFQAYAYTLQNPKGNFSTEFFAGRADDPNPRTQLYTTGHIVEWLAYSLPVEELSDARIEKAVTFLADHLQANLNSDLGVGPRGHGLHALVIYEERRFGTRPGERMARLQQKTATKNR